MVSVRGSGTTYAPVDLCLDCSQRRDAQEEAEARRLDAEWRRLLAILGVLFAVVAVPLFLCLLVRPLPVAAEGEWDRREAEARSQAEQARTRANAEARAAAEFPDRIKGWLDALGASGAEDRLSALRSLAEAGPRAAAAEPGALTAVQPLLRDRSAAVREAAFTASGRLGGSPRSAVPGLREALKHRDAKVRGHTVRMLRTLGPDAADAVPELVAALGDTSVKAAAVAALAGIGEKAVPALAQGLQDKSRAVRSGSAQALGRIGPQAASTVPRLVAMLAVQEDRGDAVEALGLIGPPAVPALTEALDGGEAETRRAAVMTLGHVGVAAKAALPRLTALAREDRSSRVREVAEVAVRRITGVK